MSSNNKLVQDGIFFTYIKACNENKVNFSGTEYSQEKLIPKVNKDNIQQILSNSGTVKFQGITTDQQLYKPMKDAKVLVSALSYPNRPVKLIFRRNGAIWFEDKKDLSSAGLCLYTLSELDLGKYDVTAEVQLENESVGIGTASFDVAVFELDPFQVIIESQSMSQSQVMTANIHVSILHVSYSGPLKVGLYCSYCREIVLRDEVTCMKGKATVSFNVSGHTAPFSLEFIVPERGYTAMIQLEGTMPHQRVPTPITANLKQNYQMSLFPQTNSVAVQGINITPAEVNNGAIFEVDSLVGDTVKLKITDSSKFVSISVFDPIKENIVHQEQASVSSGIEFTLVTGESHVIVFFAGIVKDLMIEGFLVSFKSPEKMVIIDTPSETEAGGPLKLTLNNPSKSESELFLIIFDKRKTHSSLYKKIGERVHSHLKGGLQTLPNTINYNFEQRRLLVDDEYRKKKEVEEEERRRRDEIMMMKEEEMDRDVKSYAMPKMSKKSMGKLKMASKPAPSPPMASPIPSIAPGATPSIPIAEPSPVPDIPTSSTEEPTEELFEEFEEVLYVETLKLSGNEIKIIEIDLADQITTWEVRLYSFQGLLFNEEIKNVSAVKKRFIQIRAPQIIDVDNGDSAEIEIHYRTEVNGTIEVLVNEQNFISKKNIKAGDGVLKEMLKHSGMLKAILKTSQYTLEAIKDIRLPFEQTLIYTHMVHLYPNEPYTPPQEVQIFPNPLPLIRESVHALQGYPFGCAEQTSAKLGALALAYKYHKSINSGEEVALLGMIKQGIGRLFSTYFNESKKMFGLWDIKTADERTTIQVLRNLAPLYSLLEEFFLINYKNELNEAASVLLKNKIKSFNLAAYSPNFIPQKKSDDPLEAAWALLSSDLSNKEEWLDIIKKEAKITEETCKWYSSSAWAGSLQTTAEILRALVKHEANLSEEMKRLYQKGFHFVMNNIVNGRLFSTTDTLALIGLFTGIPKVITKIELNGEIKEISQPFKIKESFTARSNVYMHWVEEKTADPFADLPAQSTKLKIDIDKTKCRVGDELNLVIFTPSDLFCPVAAICLPPHIAMMKGGGNIQQHYLPFREDKSILLELACIRPGTGHIRVIVHDMYNLEQVIKPAPLVVDIKN